MKKIGILTLQRVYNYGASLQVYALQTKLQELYGDVEIIDLNLQEWREVKLRKRYGFVGLFAYNIYTSLNIIRRYIINTFGFKDLNLIKLRSSKQNFDIFENSFLNYSKPFFHQKQLNGHYACIVVGSDQVLNPTLRYDNQNFLLEELNGGVIKCTYAASLAIPKIPANLTSRYLKAFSEFKSISVRETDGLAHLKDNEGRSPEQHLDPIFFFSKLEWQQKLSLQSTEHEPYILSYTLGDEGPEALKICQKIKTETGYQIIKIGRSHTDVDLNGLVTIWGVGPKEFIELILNASYMVTNSFHGVSFCINFGVPFSAVMLKSNDRTSRIDNVLRLFNMKDRKATSSREYKYDESTLKLDIGKSEKIRIKMLSYSTEYLKSII